MFMTNQWEIVEISSAQKKEEKTAERVRDIIANPSYYLPCRASHFTGPPFLCAPHPAEIGQPTSLRRGKGLASGVIGRMERVEKKAEAVVVVRDKRIRFGQRRLSATFRWRAMTSYPANSSFSQIS